MVAVTTVLLIDDNDLVRQAFRRILQLAGFAVLEADGGETGLELFREASPAAVLVDLRMPGLDGLEVLSRLSQEAPETPVIVVSGEGSMSDALAALRFGAWDYVTKPLLQSEILAQTVTRALDKARLLKENREHRARLEVLNDQLTKALDEIRSDQEAGRRLQHQLLPPDQQRMGHWKFSRRIFPSRALSGDFVDYFKLGEGYAGLYLTDVAGHGAASAFVTAMIVALVAKYREAYASGLSDLILEPERFLEQLNRDLFGRGLDKHATMFYAVVELKSDVMVYANAGQYPFPALFGRRYPRFLEVPGRPLGLFPDARYTRGELSLAQVDRLVVVSDGMLSTTTQQTSTQRLDMLLKLGASANDVDALALALGTGEGHPCEDDVTLLFVERSAV
ncbi:MAG: response regulator [Deltaproteobacteria bacterium]|nr:response regulator [Deltaproteobacteria bacterium]